MRSSTGRITGFKQYYLKNEFWFSLAFFLGGFLFDIITLSTPDDTFSLIQQIVYLLILAGALVLETKWDILSEEIPVWLKKYWDYRDLAVHFIFGSLLSLYSLYYFRSASLSVSFLFMSFMFGVLVLNELPKFQALGLKMRWCIWTVCIFSFFSTLVPIILGRVGILTFLLSLLLTVATIFAVYSFQCRKKPEHSLAIRQTMQWSLWIPTVFLLFYFLKILPPIPLAITEIGIYHNIEKDTATQTYKLYYERSWLKFWQNGDQDFKARKGEKIFLYASIYSPTSFSDTVYVNWLHYEPIRGWVSYQRFPIQVVGGRLNGFRGYANKANYVEGEWRAQIESSDGREIGRIAFDITMTDDPLHLQVLTR